MARTGRSWGSPLAPPTACSATATGAARRGDPDGTFHAGAPRAATTWETQLVADGKAYLVVFPDGGGFNPGYSRGRGASAYSGDRRGLPRTHHAWEMLKPDIWLAHHSEYFDLAGKRARVAGQEEVGAGVDPDGYRCFVAGKKRAFDEEVDVGWMARRRGDASAALRIDLADQRHQLAEILDLAVARRRRPAPRHAPAPS